MTVRVQQTCAQNNPDIQQFNSCSRYSIDVNETFDMLNSTVSAYL